MNISPSLEKHFSLAERVVVITGGGGLLGEMHAEAIAEAGGIPVLLDLDNNALTRVSKSLLQQGWQNLAIHCDITHASEVEQACREVLAVFGRVDGLVNNAAVNPRVSSTGSLNCSERFESFPLDVWARDIDVGLTGALLLCQIFGPHLKASASVVNIASDLSVISPDQRLYHRPGRAENDQPVKPISYSVVKTGLIGLTRYLSTYWAGRGIRVNALSLGGVEHEQDPEFIRRVEQLIPLGRLARRDEYKAALVFLLSGGASYLTGQNIVIDGGRTVW